MSTLQNKIDFAVVFRVTKANPNGDLTLPRFDVHQATQP